MVKRWWLLGSLFLFSACIHSGPTTFQDGLSVSKQTASFYGNGETSKARARAYSRLGAISQCLSRGQIPRELKTEDHSSVFSYTSLERESHYSSASEKPLTSQVRAAPVQQIYPVYDTTFGCQKASAQLEEKAWGELFQDLSVACQTREGYEPFIPLCEKTELAWRRFLSNAGLDAGKVRRIVKSYFPVSRELN